MTAKSYDYYLAVATAAKVTREQAKRVLLAAEYIPLRLMPAELSLFYVVIGNQELHKATEKKFSSRTEMFYFITRMRRIYAERFYCHLTRI